MNEKELNFDRKKHICYSSKVKKVIIKHLQMRFPNDRANVLWEQIQRQYVEFLKELPYLGGKKCTHNGIGGTYDCIAVFAYYEVLDEKPDISELYEMNNEVFLPSFKTLGKIANANSPVAFRLMNMIFMMTADKDRKVLEDTPHGYIMKVKPYDKNTGIHYRFEQCPIAEFAKDHNYLDLMPAFCNGDYPAMELIHAGLIRKHTCANSDVCDYWIVGDKSPYLPRHIRKKDEKGYWYND